jgi:hypothetical protein
VGARGDSAARCGVEGIIRTAADSPCCGTYIMCPIWRAEKERLWTNLKSRKAEEHQRTDGSLAWA